jgi:hypothetical protein
MSGVRLDFSDRMRFGARTSLEIRARSYFLRNRSGVSLQCNFSRSIAK